jgi:serine/threonine protein kinase
VIVFEVLKPIYEAPTITEFWDAYLDIFQALNFLWEKGIEHCDVSVENLMFRKEDGGAICGVLNDWDLSRIKTADEEYKRSPGTRTGTKPFMAYDLLTDNPPPHLMRHDFESMMYVLIWCGCRYGQGGIKLAHHRLEDWCADSWKVLANAKYTILMKDIDNLVFTDWFSPLKLVCRLLRQVFQKGQKALQSFEDHCVEIERQNSKVKGGGAQLPLPTFDETTNNGEVTFENIWSTLVEDGPEDGRYAVARSTVS